MASQDSWDGVGLNGSWVDIATEFDVLDHDWVEAGVLELRLVSMKLCERMWMTYVGDGRWLLVSFSDNLDGAEVIKLDALAVEELGAKELLLELLDSWTGLTLLTVPLVLLSIVCPAWDVFLAGDGFSRVGATSISCGVVVGLRIDPASLACIGVRLLVLGWTCAIDNRSAVLDIRQGLSHGGIKAVQCFDLVSGDEYQSKFDESSSG